MSQCAVWSQIAGANRLVLADKLFVGAGKIILPFILCYFGHTRAPVPVLALYIE